MPETKMLGTMILDGISVLRFNTIGPKLKKNQLCNYSLYMSNKTETEDSWKI